MCVKHRHCDSSQHLAGNFKQNRTPFNSHLRFFLLAVLLIGSILHANMATAWRVNAFLLDQPGLPDPYTAAEIGCALSGGNTRIAECSLIG